MMMVMASLTEAVGLGEYPLEGCKESRKEFLRLVDIFGFGFAVQHGKVLQNARHVLYEEQRHEENLQHFKESESEDLHQRLLRPVLIHEAMGGIEQHHPHTQFDDKAAELPRLELLLLHLRRCPDARPELSTEDDDKRRYQGRTDAEILHEES